jgi:hypothetical protein
MRSRGEPFLDHTRLTETEAPSWCKILSVLLGTFSICFEPCGIVAANTPPPSCTDLTNRSLERPSTILYTNCSVVELPFVFFYFLSPASPVCIMTCFDRLPDGSASFPSSACTIVAQLEYSPDQCSFQEGTVENPFHMLFQRGCRIWADIKWPGTATVTSGAASFRIRLLRDRG